MRLLQLDLGEQRIEFHPYVTVLRGLDDSLRSQLIDALASVSNGDPTVAGLLEAHGVVLDLTRQSLELLDLGNSATSFDIIVRRDQLPGSVAPAGATGRGQLERARAEALDRASRAQAEVDRTAVALRASQEALERAGDGTSGDGSAMDATRAELERLTARRHELEAAAESARAEHARAQEAQRLADERVEQARALRAESARACSVAAGALESARAVRDPLAAAGLEAANERLVALEAAAAAHADGDVDAPVVDYGFADPAAEVTRLESRRLEIEASLLALDTVDPYPVQIALEQLKAGSDEGELVVSQEAIQLADDLTNVNAVIAEQSAADAASGSAIAVARRRLDAARAAVFDAERAVRLPEVDRLDVESLENAHEQVLIAQDRAEKRLAGGRAKQKLDEVREAEQEILDRLGFRTYTEFVLGTSIVNVDPERERRLEVARAELASAEDALADLEADVDKELARASLVARRRELHARAIELLGDDPGDDIEWTLRHHRVRVRDVDNRAGRLKSALESAGMVLGEEDVPASLLTDLAKIWLSEQSETAGRRQQLEQEAGEVETRLALAREAAKALEEAPTAEDVAEAASTRAARQTAQLEEARAGVRVAQQRIDRQAQVEEDIAQRKAELEDATKAEEAVAAALSQAEREAADAAEAEHAAASERSRREAELANAIDAERRASDSLSELADRLSHAAQSADRGELERAVADATAAAGHAQSALDASRKELDSVEDRLRALDGGGASSTGTLDAVSVDELEWYLLSRVAAQRSVSYAGSVPLVLDDSLAGVSGGDLAHLLSRLERMSTAVQVIVVSESDEVAAWTASVGEDRAMTLYPQPA